jgi:hypothetical protein
MIVDDQRRDNGGWASDVTIRVTVRGSKETDRRNKLKNFEIWLAALDDFRNWLIREAA